MTTGVRWGYWRALRRLRRVWRTPWLRRKETAFLLCSFTLASYRLKMSENVRYALAVNCGSSSIKFRAYSVEAGDKAKEIGSGSAKDVAGDAPSLTYSLLGAEKQHESLDKDASYQNGKHRHSRSQFSSLISSQSTSRFSPSSCQNWMEKSPSSRIVSFMAETRVRPSRFDTRTKTNRQSSLEWTPYPLSLLCTITTQCSSSNTPSLPFRPPSQYSASIPSSTTRFRKSKRPTRSLR